MVWQAEHECCEAIEVISGGATRNLRRAASKGESTLGSMRRAREFGLRVVHMLIGKIDAKPDVVVLPGPVGVGHIDVLRICPIVRHEVILHTEVGVGIRARY